jgi:hypothetical protein
MTEPLTREGREEIRHRADGTVTRRGQPSDDWAWMACTLAEDALCLLADLERVERERDEAQRALDNLRKHIGPLLHEQAEARARLAVVEDSMVRHFQEEHIAGDGPEIDRLKARLARIVAALEVLSEESASFPIPVAIPEAHKERLLVLRGHIADVHALAIAKGER